MTHKIDKDYLSYKIKINYIKYIAKNNKKYLAKILNIIHKKSINKNIIGGDGSNINLTLDFILKNIDIIIRDIDFFYEILLIIENHDRLMTQINPKYKKFEYNQNILEYLNKIYNQEFIFV